MPANDTCVQATQCWQAGCGVRRGAARSGLPVEGRLGSCAAETGAALQEAEDRGESVAAFQTAGRAEQASKMSRRKGSSSCLLRGAGGGGEECMGLEG